MRLMEMIRRKGAAFLTIFLLIFVVSVFAGLGVSTFFGSGMSGGPRQQTETNAANPRLVNEGELADAVIRVNGRIIDQARFSELYTLVSTQDKQGGDDPARALSYYGQTAGYLIREEVVIGKGEELGIKVSAEDIAKAKDENSKTFLEAEEQPSGNVLGDLTKKLGTARERKAAFNEYLLRSGMTEQLWLSRVRRELMVRNTRDKLQEDIDTQKALKAAETKALVDAKLNEGLPFADVARLYSEDDNAAGGGDLKTWISRGLLLEDVEKIVFAAEKGTVTDWIEVPAGWQRFEVYDKQKAEGPEFEQEKPKLIEAIKVDKGEDYTPTEDEIAQKYEKIMARQIFLKKEDPGKADEKINELMEQATIEINEPFVLASQVLMDDKLQPPAEMDFDALVELCKTVPIGEGYDFELLKLKLENGKPKPAAAEAAEAAAEETPAADGAEPLEVETKDIVPPADAAPAPAAEASDSAADTAAGEAAASAADATTPLYALAIALLNKGIENDPERVGYFPYFMIGKTYMDWLADEEHAQSQPVDRDQARAEAEKAFERAARGLEYSSINFALRGLNLAWLGQKEEAAAQLEKAQQYAPKQMGGPWDYIRQGYEVLDDKDKLKQIDELITKIRQEQLQKMIQQQQQQQQSGGAGGQMPPIQIPQDGGAPVMPPTQ